MLNLFRLFIFFSFFCFFGIIVFWLFIQKFSLFICTKLHAHHPINLPHIVHVSSPSLPLLSSLAVFRLPPWFALRFSTFSSTRKTTKSNEQLQILLCTISDWLRGRCYNRWAWRKWSKGGGEGRGERFSQQFVCLWVSCLTYCPQNVEVWEAIQIEGEGVSGRLKRSWG